MKELSDWKDNRKIFFAIKHWDIQENIIEDFPNLVQYRYFVTYVVVSSDTGQQQTFF